MTAAMPKDPLLPVRDYARDPIRAGRDIRLALRGDCGAFIAAMLAENAFSDDHPGFHFAIGLLANSDSLVPALATPSVTSFPQALRVTRRILDTDGNFINFLLSEMVTRKDMTDPVCAVRVLDLAGECVSHLTNWRWLVRIHRSGDPEVRTKCANLLARFRFSDEAGFERFRRSEPRVRANIIQTLWETDRESATSVLEAGLRDENNRVVGNTCVALYNAGDSRALSRRAKRPSRVWPIAQAAVILFFGSEDWSISASRLLEALQGNDPALRKKSIASLARLKPGLPSESPEAEGDGADPGLSFVSAPYTPKPGGCELWLHAGASSGSFVPRLRPIDLFVEAGEALLLEYSVEEFAHSDDAALRIAYPAGSAALGRAFRDSLAEKPAAQSWALSSYRIPAGDTGSSGVPVWISDPAALAALLDSGPACSSAVGDAVARVLNVPSEITEQHLVLILDGSGFDPEPTRSLCDEKHIRLHCWRLSERASHSGPGVIRNEEQWASVWPCFLASLQARYILRTKCAPTAVRIRNSGAKPARFSRRIELLKGGSDA